MDLAKIFLAYPAARRYILGGTVSGSPTGQLVVNKRRFMFLKLWLSKADDFRLFEVDLPNCLILLYYKPHGLKPPGKAPALKWST